jgi:hypothetical protein
MFQPCPFPANGKYKKIRGGVQGGERLRNVKSRLARYHYRGRWNVPTMRRLELSVWIAVAKSLK